MKQDHYELECPIRDYDWGTPGAGLLRSMLAGRSIPEGTPLAELWMGAHPSAPSLVLPDREPLDAAIARDPAHFLGATLAERGVTTLPFLFKVLEAKRPLSIQAHPDAELAKQLHARDPKNYPDANHKPELAMSLGGMEALLGFRPVAEIERALGSYPELRALVLDPAEKGAPPAGEEKAWLKERFARLMRASRGAVEEASQAHLRRVAESVTNPDFRLFGQLTQHFGTADPGVFCGYFLNAVNVPNERAVFLGPNEPHAYLRGPILECMSSSDNVVRAGLTSKFRDVDTLIDMLHYGTEAPKLLSASPAGPGVESFEVPVKDFVVRSLTVPQRLTLPPNERPSILVAVKGSRPRKETAPGDIVLVQGTVVLLPGDLAERGVSTTIAAAGDARIYEATVHPDFGA